MKKKILAIALTILGSLTLTAYDSKGITAEVGNLDGLGLWGAIPCTEEVANILLMNQDEDYIIEFHDDSNFGIFSYTGEILGMCKADWYECQSYNQEGYMKNTSVSLVIFEKEEDAKAFYANWLTIPGIEYFEHKLDGNVFYMRTLPERGLPIYNENTTKASFWGNNLIVADRHCVYQGDNRYVYYSKPVTALECAELVAADALMKEMACDYIMSDNEKLAIQIGGSAKAPWCKVGTTYVEVNNMNASAVKAKGDTLLIKAHATLYSYESITEVKKFGSNLMVYIRVYADEDKVSFENYLEKPTCVELFGMIDLKNQKLVPEIESQMIIGAQ